MTIVAWKAQAKSAPSAPKCVTPVDTFPPAAPKSLAHIAGANGVTAYATAGVFGGILQSGYDA